MGRDTRKGREGAGGRAAGVKKGKGKGNTNNTTASSFSFYLEEKKSLEKI